MVEDEQVVVDAVSFNLAGEGFQVSVAADGESALRADLDDFDIVILDLNLPKLSGLEVCRQIRAYSTVPILILTARAAEPDRVIGLDSGADDYVVKPFSTAELISRVRSIVRRTQMERSSTATTRRVGSLTLDLSEQTAQIAGREIPLTQSEFRLLALLASDPERPFSRREIIEQLWRSRYVGTQRTCDVHVKNLRRKVEADPAHPERIVTVRGVGYLLRGI